jgi:hypothetical protein
VEDLLRQDRFKRSQVPKKVRDFKERHCTFLQAIFTPGASTAFSGQSVPTAAQSKTHSETSTSTSAL